MNWRLLSYDQFDGPTNMAIDQAILEEHLDGKVPPTLRLYGFKPAAVSLGYAQTVQPAELAAISAAGFDVVRRPTGGRAVLHADDFTYAFVGTSVERKSDPQNKLSEELPTVPMQVGTKDGFLSPSISVAYKQICRALMIAMQEFGIDLEMGAANADYKTSYDCFRAVTGADLHYQGKKMIGSAQYRRKNAVLQHGSILLNQGQDVMSSIFGALPDQTNGTRHANLFQVLGKSVSTQALQDAMKKGFQSAFDKTLTISELTDSELRRAKELRSDYTSVET